MGEANPALGKLKPHYFLAAYMEAVGKRVIEIADALNYSPAHISSIRKIPEYRAEVERVRAEIRSKMTDRAARLAERFNEEAEPAFETLQGLHKGAEAEAVRLNAANSILDRAPDAPKVSKNMGSLDRRIIIQLPMKTIGNMKDGLKEAGYGEVVEMLEHDGQFVPDGDVSETIQAVSLDEFEAQHGT